MTAQPCGATRPRLRDPGWECTGRGLIVVTTTATAIVGVRIPIVLPARALDVIEPESWWDSPIVPFTGGDHMHLCVPRNPPPREFAADALFIAGDVATRARLHVPDDAPFACWEDIGHAMPDGGQLFIGGPA